MSFERMERLFAESEQHGVRLSMPSVVGDIEAWSIDEWTEMRRTGIGGSDAGTIFGVNPYGDPEVIAKDKMGLLEKKPVDWKTQARFDAGHVMETVIAKMFGAKTGFDVFNDTLMYRHSEYTYMLADCDAFCFDNEGMKCGLEFKYINPDDLKYRWHSGIYGMPETGVKAGSESYVIQCRHYMSVLNLDRWYICVWGGNNADDLVIIRIDRDFTIEKQLIEKEGEFWKLVQQGSFPYVPTHTKDNFEKLTAGCGCGVPETGTVALAADMIPGYDLASYAREIMENSRLKSEKNREIRELDRRNCELYKPFIEALTASQAQSGQMDLNADSYYAISYKSRSASRSMDYDVLQLQHPEIYRMLLKEGILTVTIPKPVFSMSEKKRPAAGTRNNAR